MERAIKSNVNIIKLCMPSNIVITHEDCGENFVSMALLVDICKMCGILELVR